MAIEAIIFDMDGLLVDSEPLWEEARQVFAARVGKPWNRQDKVNITGVSTDEWAQYMIDRMELDATLQGVQEDIIDQMAAMYEQKIPFLPGAVEAVHWAAARYPTALASGSPHRLIDIVTQSPELEGRFQAIVSADEVGIGKPDPAVYLETAKRLDIVPEKCLCLEDSPVGVLSGRRANMYVINVPDAELPLTPEQAKHADLVLESLEDYSAEVIKQLEQMR